MSRIVISIYDDLGNPHYGGGGALMVDRLARHLAREHDVTVVSSSFPGSRSGWRDGVRFRYLPVGWVGPRAGQLLYHAVLPMAAALGHYDLWVESFTPPFSTSLLPLFARGRPVVGLVQMLAGRESSQRYRLPFWRLERRGVRAYRHLVVLNEPDREFLRRENPEAEVVLLTNGMDVARVPVGKSPARHILYLGRIDVHVKGLDLLVEAYAAAAGEADLPPLVIAGSGTHREEQRLRELVRDQVGARGEVRLVGRVAGEEKARLLKEAAFLVMPSRYETFGLAALEAMAHGRTVVVFDLPRLAWLDRSCCVRVPPYEPAGLARAMTELWADDRRRGQLGVRARSVAESYDWSVVSERYSVYLNRVLSARSIAAGS